MQLMSAKVYIHKAAFNDLHTLSCRHNIIKAHMPALYFPLSMFKMHTNANAHMGYHMHIDMHTWICK